MSTTANTQTWGPGGARGKSIGHLVNLASRPGVGPDRHYGDLVATPILASLLSWLTSHTKALSYPKITTRCDVFARTRKEPSLGSWFLGRGLEIAFCSRPMWPAAERHESPVDSSQIQAPATRSGSLLSCICTCSLTPARDRRDHRGLPEGRRRNTKKQHRILRGISEFRAKQLQYEQGRTERSGHPSSKPQRNVACTFVPRKCSTFWEPGLSTYQSPNEHTDIKPWPYHVIAVESGLPASPPGVPPELRKVPLSWGLHVPGATWQCRPLGSSSTGKFLGRARSLLQILLGNPFCHLILLSLFDVASIFCPHMLLTSLAC